MSPESICGLTTGTLVNEACTFLFCLLQHLSYTSWGGGVVNAPGHKVKSGSSGALLCPPPPYPLETGRQHVHVQSLPAQSTKTGLHMNQQTLTAPLPPLASPPLYTPILAAQRYVIAVYG